MCAAGPTAARSMSIARSTVSAVRTPDSDMPSSTSVMATAGRMPTTTVSASRTRDMAAMLPSMRPMKESTISSDEMSMRTPRAWCLTMLAVRSSCSVMASRSCMSTWMETSRNSPILMMGMRSTSAMLRRWANAANRLAGALQGDGEGGGERRLRGHRLQLHAQMHDRLRDLRPDAADETVGPHQPRGGNRLQKMLGHERVDRRHARDVDDGDGSAGLDDALEQVLHDHLGPRAVEGADEREREDAVPERDHRSRQLEHLLTLPGNELLATLLVDLGREQSEAVQQDVGDPRLLGENGRVAADLLAEAREERLLEREDEHRRLARREAPPRPLRRQHPQLLTHRIPGLGVDVVDAGGGGGVAKTPQELARLLAQLRLLDEIPTQTGGLQLTFDPGGQQLTLALVEDLNDATSGIADHVQRLSLATSTAAAQRPGRKRRTVSINTSGAIGSTRYSSAPAARPWRR